MNRSAALISFAASACALSSFTPALQDAFGGETLPGAGVGIVAMQLGDMDSDGLLDVVTAAHASGELRVLRAQASGGLALAHSVGGTNSLDLVLFDADQDGKLDFGEFCAFVRDREEGEFTEDELKARFEALDEDGSGKVDMHEYLQWSLKDALARTEALRVIAVRQLLANEEGAKQAATALERVRHDTSEAAAERHNALRYRPVAVPRNTRLQRKRCVATATAWIPHCR